VVLWLKAHLHTHIVKEQDALTGQVNLAEEHDGLTEEIEKIALIIANIRTSLANAPWLGFLSPITSSQNSLHCNYRFIVFKMQYYVYLRLGKGSISPEQQPPSSLLVSFHNQLQDLPPALSAVDIAQPQYRPFAVTELVEAKERMIAHTAGVAVIGRSLLLPI